MENQPIENEPIEPSPVVIPTMNDVTEAINKAVPAAVESAVRAALDANNAAWSARVNDMFARIPATGDKKPEPQEDEPKAKKISDLFTPVNKE